MQVALIAVLVVVVIAAARVAARWQRPAHPPIDLGSLAATPGIVLFTSTDCANCERARAVVGSIGVPVREVTWEGEPALMEGAGVQAVPLTAVVGAGGTVTWLGAGVPSSRALRSAVRRAGLAG